MWGIFPTYLHMLTPYRADLTKHFVKSGLNEIVLYMKFLVNWKVLWSKVNTDYNEDIKN